MHKIVFLLTLKKTKKKEIRKNNNFMGLFMIDKSLLYVLTAFPLSDLLLDWLASCQQINVVMSRLLHLSFIHSVQM